MSDILIRGMEMPDKDHLVLVEIDNNGEVFAAYDGGRTKLAQYKAIPVPPHGDLIDRNVLYHNMFIGPDEKVFPDRDVDNFPHEMRFEDIKRFIRKAQTVIQASE